MRRYNGEMEICSKVNEGTNITILLPMEGNGGAKRLPACGRAIAFKRGTFFDARGFAAHVEDRWRFFPPPNELGYENAPRGVHAAVVE